jgi:hypothetical protein
VTSAAAIALVAALFAAQSVDPAALVAEGDRHFADRAKNARGGTCDPAEVEAARDLYAQALRAAPDSLPAQVGVLRSIFFRSGFCGEGGAVQKRSFEHAKRLAEDAEKRVEKRVGQKLERGRFEPFRAVPEAAALFFWCGVAWGQWSLDHKLAAAWQGAAGHIRELAEAAIALDAGYEQGSPHLLLGRLHADSPKLPLVTGFVSRKTGLENLRRAHEISPANTVSAYFLALAVLEHEKDKRADALSLLREVAASEPRPGYTVEDRHYAELARARLAELEKTP